ncbi:hypothetical protein GIB67_035573 [Kingdonia uniflora]|uniref:Uncharacterized protein n=1 Tax=Kingdonia uniflora TaxID=39325 RepID=A0A7J7LCZ9_9MAGN|nr:hypothetical protein GIB67_035573 [Kingdonia uniflora]
MGNDIKREPASLCNSNFSRNGERHETSKCGQLSIVISLSELDKIWHGNDFNIGQLQIVSF